MVTACSPCHPHIVGVVRLLSNVSEYFSNFQFFFQYILRFAYLAPIFELWTFWSWVNHLTISATKAKWFCNSKRARSWCKLYAILKCHSSPSKDTYSAIGVLICLLWKGLDDTKEAVGLMSAIQVFFDDAWKMYTLEAFKILIFSWFEFPALNISNFFPLLPLNNDFDNFFRQFL